MSRDGAGCVVEMGLYPLTDLSRGTNTADIGAGWEKGEEGAGEGGWTASSALQNGMQEKYAAAWAGIGTLGTWIWR